MSLLLFFVNESGQAGPIKIFGGSLNSGGPFIGSSAASLALQTTPTDCSLDKKISYDHLKFAVDPTSGIDFERDGDSGIRITIPRMLAVPACQNFKPVVEQVSSSGSRDIFISVTNDHEHGGNFHAYRDCLDDAGVQFDDDGNVDWDNSSNRQFIRPFVISGGGISGASGEFSAKIFFASGLNGPANDANKADVAVRPTGMECAAFENLAGGQDPFYFFKGTRGSL